MQEVSENEEGKARSQIDQRIETVIARREALGFAERRAIALTSLRGA